MKRSKRIIALLLSVVMLLVCMGMFPPYYVSDYGDETESIMESTENVETVETVETTIGIVESTEESTELPTEESTDESTEENTISMVEIKQQEIQTKLDQISTITDTLLWFKAYKGLVNEYSQWVDPPLTVYDLYTSEEIWYMQRCIETETFEQDFDSRCNVASVIINRIGDSWFGSNAVEVVTKENQFAYFRTEISEETKLALEYVAMFGDTTNGAIFFHSHDEAYPTFCKASYMFTDNCGHHFYK